MKEQRLKFCASSLRNGDFVGLWTRVRIQQFTLCVLALKSVVADERLVFNLVVHESNKLAHSQHRSLQRFPSKTLVQFT